jgi:hypothetical protein
MSKVKRIMVFPNGNLAVIGEDGKQIPELQKGWMEMICEFLESKGIDPSEIPSIEAMGDGLQFKPFRIEGGWNWKVERP